MRGEKDSEEKGSRITAPLCSDDILSKKRHVPDYTLLVRISIKFFLKTLWKHDQGHNQRKYHSTIIGVTIHKNQPIDSGSRFDTSFYMNKMYIYILYEYVPSVSFDITLNTIIETRIQIQCSHDPFRLLAAYNERKAVH